MTKNAELIKAAIRVGLEEYGCTMEEFEERLASFEAEKTAGIGTLLEFDPKSIGAMANGVMNIGGLTAVGVGALGGYGAYQGYKGLKSTEADNEKQMREKQQYLNAIQSLTAAQADARKQQF